MGPTGGGCVGRKVPPPMVLAPRAARLVHGGRRRPPSAQVVHVAEVGGVGRVAWARVEGEGGLCMQGGVNCVCACVCMRALWTGGAGLGRACLAEGGDSACSLDKGAGKSVECGCGCGCGCGRGCGRGRGRGRGHGRGSGCGCGLCTCVGWALGLGVGWVG